MIKRTERKGRSPAREEIDKSEETIIEDRMRRRNDREGKEGHEKKYIYKSKNEEERNKIRKS